MNADQEPNSVKYRALRENCEQTHYPINQTPHFESDKIIWDEKLKTFYVKGSKWYDFLSQPPDYQIKNLYHKSNNEGRNGNDFYHNPDIIASGCSVSAGVGLPHNFLWPEIISKITNQKINNV